MSDAMPRAPPEGWWTMIRAFDSATRIPGSPAASRKLPIDAARSEEHTSELQSLMRISYAVFSLQKKEQRRIDCPGLIVCEAQPRVYSTACRSSLAVALCATRTRKQCALFL